MADLTKLTGENSERILDIVADLQTCTAEEVRAELSRRHGLEAPVEQVERYMEFLRSGFPRKLAHAGPGPLEPRRPGLRKPVGKVSLNVSEGSPETGEEVPRRGRRKPSSDRVGEGSPDPDPVHATQADPGPDAGPPQPASAPPGVVKEPAVTNGEPSGEQGAQPARLHYGWVVLAVGTLAIFGALGLARFGYSLVLPAMQKGLALNNTQSGILAAANLVGYLLLAVAGGMLASRFRAAYRHHAGAGDGGPGDGGDGPQPVVRGGHAVAGRSRAWAAAPPTSR